MLKIKIMRLLTIIGILLISNSLFSQNIEDKIYRCMVSNFEQIEVNIVELMQEIENNLISNKVVSGSAESRLEKLIQMAATGSIPGARTLKYPIIELKINNNLQYCSEVISSDFDDLKNYPLNQFFGDLETLIDQNTQDISTDQNKLKKLTAQLLVDYTKQFDRESKLWKMIQLKYLYIFTPPLTFSNLSEYFDHLDNNIDSSKSVRIFTDANNIITFDGEVVEVHQLCALLRPKILKEEKSILLQSYRATSYKVYKAIYDEIMDCYSAMRNERSLEIFNKTYDELSLEDRKKINRLIPKIINELEPK